MQAVTGIFSSAAQAEKAVADLRSDGFNGENITTLTPGGKVPEELTSVPVDTAEQPGMGKAIGAVVGGAAGLSGAAMVALIPGVGPDTAIGLLAGAALTAAGATIGSVVGGSVENSTTEGLPEDEIFVYEDALRRGCTVVIAMVEDGSDADSLRKVLKTMAPTLSMLPVISGGSDCAAPNRNTTPPRLQAASVQTMKSSTALALKRLCIHVFVAANSIR